MAELEFYDVRSKKKFKSSDFRIVTKKGRSFAVTKAPKPGTHECWRVLRKVQAEEFKKK